MAEDVLELLDAIAFAIGFVLALAGPLLPLRAGLVALEALAPLPVCINTLSESSGCPMIRPALPAT